MNFDTVIFIISAIVAVLGASMMIFQRNPVMAVLSFMVSLLAQAVLYIQLDALFLGAVLIIVYAGAILVLFLFVIMLLNLRTTKELGPSSSLMRSLGKYLLSFLLIMEFVFIIKSSFFKGASLVGVVNMKPDGFGTVTSVATLLFTKYLYPFELTSILILVAIVGAVVMAKKDKDTDRPLEGKYGKNE